ncbi:hypothetical protein NBE98_10790 [Clostridium swellfunianum]|uniref:hypothetical protein n=1 Tax=Clostridium swellfunianum TaxID=1367462 RepID=UPI00202EB73F|nr:hypothetical protein [Clostridium swellfunianum]MCM0648862.1 hypothetical protein [Clostridium swellfunianum]
MDLERLISEASRDKADKLEMKLPSFDNVWEEIQQQNKFASEKEPRKRSIAIGDWIGVAAILLIMLIVPFTITRLKNSSGEVTPANKQEQAITQADQEKAGEAASKFLTIFYTIDDYRKVDEYNFLFPKDARTQNLKPYATTKYYNEKLTVDALSLLSVSKWTSTNFSVKEVKLTKYSEDTKAKYVVFTSDTYLKCMQKDGQEKAAFFRGQILMEYDEGLWKVGNYTERSYEPKEMFDKEAIFKNNVSTNKIVSELLPHPYNAEIYPDSLKFNGMWKGSVMPEFEAQMKKLGWELYDGMGSKKFYKKDINGKEIKISILPNEQGGPEEKNASTTISVNIEEY